MSEELETLVQNKPANPITQDMQNSFVKNIWGEDAPINPQIDTVQEITKAAIDNSTQQSATNENRNEEVLDPNVYLKNKWGWDSEEVADNEIKQLREKATKGYEYKNEESKRIAEYINEGKEDELYQFLDNKKKVQKLSTADLSDKNIAAELVKFGLQKDNPNLSTDEVDFLFNEKYSIPPKPVKEELEEDDDYNVRVSSWQMQVGNIEKRMIIEAKMNQPKLSQLSTELVLPEINKGTEVKKEPTPEELEAFNNTKNSFLQSAKQTIDGFNGFTAQVKDKDVDYSVTYSPSQEEKTLISEKLNKLAESGFDANELFAERWYDINAKTFKIDQMTEDLSRIFMGKNSDQKLAVDAANKRLEAYLKEKKNVSVTEGNRNSTFQPDGDKTPSQKLAEKFFA